MNLVSTQGGDQSFHLPKNDLRLVMRIQNNLLFKAVTERYRNVNRFCRDAKARGYAVDQRIVSALMNFKISPFVKGNPHEFKPVCRQIEHALGIPAEDLFPAKLYEKLGVNKNIIAFNSSHGPIALANRQPHLIPAGIEVHPEVRVIDQELREQMEKVLKTLRYREREVLKLYYGFADGSPMTLEQIGQVFKIEKQAVHQIICRALTRLQHPVRARKLVDFLPPEGPHEEKLKNEMDENRKKRLHKPRNKRKKN